MVDTHRRRYALRSFNELTQGFAFWSASGRGRFYGVLRGRRLILSKKYRSTPLLTATKSSRTFHLSLVERHNKWKGISAFEQQLKINQSWGRAMNNLHLKLLITSLAIGTAFAISPAHAETVATISGCYDCGTFDTPSLVFHNTSGGTLTNSQLSLQGYQGLNNGLTATVNLGTLLAGDTQFFWGSLPGVSGVTTPGNLTAYDYDDQYIGTANIINDPTCGGTGCAPGGGPQWYAQVGNFSVTFTALISGGVHNGQAVFSVFSPNSNATGGFVGWLGLDPNGYSENPLYDVHTGSITGTLANIDLGTPPVVPLPGALPLFASGLVAIGLIMRRRKRNTAGSVHEQSFSASV
jgi:hypothetical protein